MKSGWALLLSGSLLWGSQAPAADVNGDFAIKGAGMLTCRVFLNERDLESNVYYMIGGWLDGYLSSVNQYADETYDVATYESSELLLLVIFNHCKDNPDDVLFTVVNSIVATISPDRLQEKSALVGIRVGEREGRLYTTVLQRMQVQLKQLGHLAEGAEAGFDDATITAIQAFQSSIGFDPSGFPDQATLWRLFRRD